MTGVIDERGQVIRLEINRERKTREEEDEQTYQEVADEIQSIRAELQ
jgi:hypothetical protein